jgi:uncharacterized protein
MTVPLIYTYTGRRLNPLDPDPADIVIEDIAHALACCNRFAGHAREPISVAQHSVYAARMCYPVSNAVSLQALLHDAAESILGDMTKWLKAAAEMAAYREAEHRVQRVIYRKFGCAEEQHPEVDVVDRLLVRYEMKQLFPSHCTVGGLMPDREADYPPLTDQEIERVGYWTPWSWQQAEAEFLSIFRYLYGATNAHQGP